MVTEEKKKELDRINKKVYTRPSGSPKKCGTCEHIFKDKCPKKKRVKAKHRAEEIEYPPSEQAVESYMENHDVSRERAVKNLKESKIENLANMYSITEELARQYLEDPPDGNAIWWNDPNPCDMYEYRGHWIPDPKKRGISPPRKLSKGDKEEADYKCLKCGSYIKKEELDPATGHCPYCEGRRLQKIRTEPRTVKAK